MIDRRTVIKTTLALPLMQVAGATMSNAGSSQTATSTNPLLQRIKAATISVKNLDESIALYSEWLGYELKEKFSVSEELAASWAAPAMHGNKGALLYSKGAPDVYIRMIEADSVTEYQGLTTHGWNAIEIIAEDVHALDKRLKKSPFQILAGAKALNGYPSIVAMQVKGPSEEVLYLTMETGDRTKSALPEPHAFVGRPFIMVVAGTNIDTMLDWYSASFNMARRRVMSTPIDILQEAQKLPAEHAFTLGTMALASHGNLLEFNAYPSSAGARPKREGQLPPGVSMVSFEVEKLDAINLPFISQPAAFDEAGYNGCRAATVVGPAGELIELIEK